MPTRMKAITDSRIKIALVGCGRISKNHISAIKEKAERANLVAICDINKERLRQTINSLDDIEGTDGINHQQPKCYEDYDALLKDTIDKKLKLDLVIIATPSGLHPSQVVKAAKAGVNVCTEKPMATRLDDGINMVRACDEAGVKLFVVKQNRFNSTLQLLKRQLDKGRFGKLCMVTVNVFWQRPQIYYDQDEWRGTWEFDGGALMNQASHYVDLLNWLVGPVESLSASTATIGRRIEVEDTAALQIRWRNGALGTMAVTMLTYPKNLEGSITLIGEKGTVKVGGRAVNKIEHWEFADESDDDKLVDEVNYETTSVYGMGHPRYYENILNAIEGKEKALCDGREGLKSLELLIGAYKSARDGRTIHFPLIY